MNVSEWKIMFDLSIEVFVLLWFNDRQQQGHVKPVSYLATLLQFAVLELTLLSAQLTFLEAASKDTTKECTRFKGQTRGHLHSKKFSAQLSQYFSSLELLVYPSSGVRLLSASSTIFKDLLQNCMANQSQISCGASMGRRNGSKWSRSHDQDVHHIYGKKP